MPINSRTLSILFLISFFYLGCLNNDPHKSDFIRLSSNADSAKNMYVLYVSASDTNRKMFRSYANDGSLLGISFFYKRKKDGHWVEYFDGKVSYEGDFVNGHKEGIHKFYFPNGKISLIEEYSRGEKVNIWFYYNEDGTLDRKEEYPPKK
jgi:antitoxin component YwqK of YwqJK toxin-antitoxin module